MIRARYKPGAPNTLLLLGELRRAWSQFRKESAGLLHRSRARAAQRIRFAYARAKQAGFLAGEREAERDRSNLLLQAQEAYESALRIAHRDCLDLVLALTREVLATELTSSVSSIATRVTQAVSQQLERRKLRILVHSSQFSALRSEFTVRSPELAEALIADDSVPCGKARIESLAGSLQVDWETCLHVLHARLHMRLEHTCLNPIESEGSAHVEAC